MRLFSEIRKRVPKKYNSFSDIHSSRIVACECLLWVFLARSCVLGCYDNSGSNNWDYNICMDNEQWLHKVNALRLRYSWSKVGFLWCSVMIVIWSLILGFAILPEGGMFFNIISIFIVILLCVYLLIDTQLILGGKSFELELDDYVFGSFILYIDIIGIFVRLVELFGHW